MERNMGPQKSPEYNGFCPWETGASPRPNVDVFTKPGALRTLDFGNFYGVFIT